MPPDDDAALRERFEQGTLTPAEFDHVAHLRVAWSCLRDDGLSAGARRYVQGLKRFTELHGAQRKYHDTLTHALLHLIYDEQVAGPAGESFAAFRERCPQLFERARALLERHYSSEVLDSPAARAAFVEPDRAPLPRMPTADRGDE